MRRMRKGMILMFLIMLLTANIRVEAAEGENDTTVDFVLVMDCTGSLNDSDPQKWGVAAAELFMETLPTENVRVSVIGFGAAWERDEIYVTRSNNRSYSLVTEAFPLSESGGEEKLEKIRQEIERIGDKRGDYTQIGYALTAAVDVLENGNAAEDSACVILVSDGRITGQNDYEAVSSFFYKYDSIENAIAKLSSKKWPVYCLELNYDKKNSTNNWQGKMARNQIDHISTETGGKRIEVTGTNTILHNFTEIIERYFDVEADDETLIIKEGKAVKDFEVADMTAETNIVITGEKLDRIYKVGITDPDGSTKEYTGDVSTESRRVVFNLPQYIMGKLIQPKAGSWSVTAYGDDGVEIDIQIIPLQEIDLRLNAVKDLSAGVLKNSPVEFTANFTYNGHSYSSDTFYRDSVAYLEIVETGEKFAMNGETDNYRGTVTFDRSGTFSVKAVVESGIFRNDRKESGIYTVTVENVDVTAGEGIPDQQMAVGSALSLDCSQYFTIQDGDEVTYSFDYDKTFRLDAGMSEDGILTIEAGESDGTVQIHISAMDIDMDVPVEQSFTLTVTNEAPLVLGGEDVHVTLVSGGNSGIRKLAELMHVNTDGTAILELQEHFRDPEGLPMRYYLEGNDPETVEADILDSEAQCRIVALGQGEFALTLRAEDSCKETVSKTIYVKAEGAGSVFLKRTWFVWIILLILLVVAVLILVAAFGNRKLYGTWNVSVNYGQPISVRLSQYPHGKKSKCLLSDLVRDIGSCDFDSGEAVICTGNGISKKVVLKRLDKAPGMIIKLDGMEIDVTKKPALICRKGAQNIIEMEDNKGNMISLQRMQ